CSRLRAWGNWDREPFKTRRCSSTRCAEQRSAANGRRHGWAYSHRSTTPTSLGERNRPPERRILDQYTFAELRPLPGLGPRRLKILLWLRQHPELETGNWKFEGHIGGATAVKVGLWQLIEVEAVSS